MVLEILIVVGMFLANAATMGVAIPIIIEAIAYVFGFKVSLSLTVATLLAITVLFTTSVYLGLKKGIQRLSTINVVVGILMVVYMWIVGPTIDIFDIFTNSVGRMFAELPALLLSTDPFTKSTVPQDWSIFFILWEVAYGPFMAIFIARISRGRTVRQIIGYGMLGGLRLSGRFMVRLDPIVYGSCSMASWIL